MIGTGPPRSGCDFGISGLDIILENGAKPPPSGFWDLKNFFPSDVGRTIVAHHKQRNLIFVAVQRDRSQALKGVPNGKAATGGISFFFDIFKIQSMLLDQGFDDAVFLDGSDSVLLHNNNIRIFDPGSRKKRFNQTVVSFSLG